MCKFRHFSFFLAYFLLTVAHHVHSKNILVWGIVGSDSIRLSMTPFMERLVERGHNVSYISAWEDFEGDSRNPSKIHTYIPKKWKATMGSSWETEDTAFVHARKVFYGVPKVWYDVRGLGQLACELLYSDPEFWEWVKSSPKYDLVVVEMLVNECAYGLVHLWNSKLVIYSTTTVIPDFFDAYGLPDESSSVSDLMLGFPPGNEMTFMQRFVNAFNPILFSLIKQYSHLPRLEEITRKGWASMGLKKEVPSFSEVEKNTSLVLVTTHFSLEYPRSFPPNVIQIGGGAIARKAKPLSKEIENFLNSAKDGFIYISFGTIAEFAYFDKSTKVAFVNALGQFPKIKFLWRSAKPIGIPLPDNVLLTTWTAQQTVLAHPIIKAFISHAGKGSTVESVYFSIPMVLVPVLAEQDHNAQAISAKGAGIKLEILTLTQEQLTHAISEVLYNDRYKKAMNRLTKIYMDRPSQPLEDAVWWTEFVLRHDNVNEFLVSPSVHQPWWIRRQIDVWLTAAALVFSIIMLALYFSYAILKYLLFSLLKSKRSDQTQKLKKN